MDIRKLLDGLKKNTEAPKLYALVLDSKGDKFCMLQAGYSLEEAFGKAKTEAAARYGSSFDPLAVRLLLWDIQNPGYLLKDYLGTASNMEKDASSATEIVPVGKTNNRWSEMMNLLKKFEGDDEEMITDPNKLQGLLKDAMSSLGLVGDVKVMKVENAAQLREIIGEKTVGSKGDAGKSDKELKNDLMNRIIDTKDAELLALKSTEFSAEEYAYLAGKIGYPFVTKKKKNGKKE